ncbi:tyrosine-type recombinase/integrase [Caproiciproducens sp.]|uniref:tyrosine-type recombinase/integrase n=1 Tax=Caproiciproducens sp. TaxID=1954376 RepID=UPI003FA45252
MSRKSKIAIAEKERITREYTAGNLPREEAARSPHCLRHTCATLMQKTGQNMRDVQLILRHTSIKTTARYSHPDMDDLKAANTEYVDELMHKSQ